MSKNGLLSGMAQGAQIGLTAWMNDSLSQRRDERLNAYRKENYSLERADKKADLTASNLREDGLISQANAAKLAAAKTLNENKIKAAEVSHTNAKDIVELKGPQRKIIKDAAGVQRYTDTGENVFPDMGGVKTPDATKSGIKNEKDLRSEFQAITKDFRAQEEAFGRVMASAKNPSPAGDLALIFNYMKILDPGSVVRESEFATAAASGSLGERVKATVAKIQRGERLSPAMRSDFSQRSRSLYEEAAMGYDTRRSQYQNLATAYNSDPSRVVTSKRLYGSESYENLGQFAQGDEVDGYKLVGDDPINPDSWELMQ